MAAQNQDAQMPSVPVNDSNNNNDRGRIRRSSNFIFGALAGLIVTVCAYQFVVPMLANNSGTITIVNGDTSAVAAIDLAVVDTLRQQKAMLLLKIDSLTARTNVLSDTITKMNIAIEKIKTMNSSDFSSEAAHGTILHLFDSIAQPQ